MSWYSIIYIKHECFSFMRVSQKIIIIHKKHFTRKYLPIKVEFYDITFIKRLEI